MMTKGEGGGSGSVFFFLFLKVLFLFFLPIFLVLEQVLVLQLVGIFFVLVELKLLTGGTTLWATLWGASTFVNEPALHAFPFLRHGKSISFRASRSQRNVID